MLQTLSTVLQSLVGNPNILQDPNMRLIFNRILDVSGAASPIELSQVSQTPQIPQQIMGQPAQPAGIGGSRAGINQLQTQ